MFMHFGMHLIMSHLKVLKKITVEKYIKCCQIVVFFRVLKKNQKFKKSQFMISIILFLLLMNKLFLFIS